MITKTTANPADLSYYRGNDFDQADSGRVAELVESMAGGYDMTAPVIAVDGWEVANGRHRVLAARELGIAEIAIIDVDSETFSAVYDETGDLEMAGVVIEAMAAGVI